MQFSSQLLSFTIPDGFEITDRTETDFTLTSTEEGYLPRLVLLVAATGNYTLPDRPTITDTAQRHISSATFSDEVIEKFTDNPKGFTYTATVTSEKYQALWGGALHYELHERIIDHGWRVHLRASLPVPLSSELAVAPQELLKSITFAPTAAAFYEWYTDERRLPGDTFLAA